MTDDHPTRREALESATGDRESRRRFFGAPAMLQMKRAFEGVLAKDRFEALILRIREIMHDPGVVERTDSSFTWSSRPNRHALQSELMVVVRVDGDETQLLATDRLDSLIVRSFGKVGGAVGAGGLVIPIAASVALPQLSLLFVAGWLGGVYGGIRTLYRRLAEGRAKKLADVFDSIAHDIEHAIARS